MRVSVMIEPEGSIDFETIAILARRVEAAGFDALYLSDHFDAVFGWHGTGAPDSWALLAGIVRETERLAVGTLVTPVTLRRFTTLTKLITTVALMARRGAMSAPGDRLHLGLGAGWLAAEHDRIGIAFPDVRTRFDILEEYLRALHLIWDEDSAITFAGTHVILNEYQLEPKPDHRPRIILGGKGRVRMPRLAAKYADELNVPFVPIEQLTSLKRLLANACEELGRDSSTITFSAKRGILIGSTPSELSRRARRMQQLAGDGRSTSEYLKWLSNRWIVGTIEDAADEMHALAEAGVEHLVLQHLLPDDVDMLDVIMNEVVPHAGSSAVTR